VCFPQRERHPGSFPRGVQRLLRVNFPFLSCMGGWGKVRGLPPPLFFFFFFTPFPKAFRTNTPPPPFDSSATRSRPFTLEKTFFFPFLPVPCQFKKLEGPRTIFFSPLLFDTIKAKGGRLTLFFPPLPALMFAPLR